MPNKIHEVYPYICVKSVADAIQFYEAAFGARESYRLTEPDGRVGHAEIYLQDHILMLSEEFPEIGVNAPDGETSFFSIHLHVDNADEIVAKAVDAGAEILRAPEDQFFGERSATIRDPFGYRWMLGHSIEDVSTDEMQRRYTALFES